MNNRLKGYFQGVRKRSSQPNGGLTDYSSDVRSTPSLSQQSNSSNTSIPTPATQSAAQSPPQPPLPPSSQSQQPSSQQQSAQQQQQTTTAGNTTMERPPSYPYRNPNLGAPQQQQQLMAPGAHRPASPLPPPVQTSGQVPPNQQGPGHYPPPQHGAQGQGHPPMQYGQPPPYPPSNAGAPLPQQYGYNSVYNRPGGAAVAEVEGQGRGSKAQLIVGIDFVSHSPS